MNDQLTFKSFIIEKTMEKDKIKYDKLIKELESLNSKDNEDVKQAISALKRSRDLKESNELVDLLMKSINQNPERLMEIIKEYV